MKNILVLLVTAGESEEERVTLAVGDALTQVTLSDV